MPCDRLFYIKKLLEKCDENEVREVLDYLSRSYYLPVIIKKSELKKITTYNTRIELDKQIKQVIEQVYF